MSITRRGNCVILESLRGEHALRFSLMQIADLCTSHQECFHVVVHGTRGDRVIPNQTTLIAWTVTPARSGRQLFCVIVEPQPNVETPDLAMLLTGGLLFSNPDDEMKVCAEDLDQAVADLHEAIISSIRDCFGEWSS